jgi:uncharacterized membrane protein
MGEVKVTFTVLFFAQIWFVAIVDLFFAIEKKRKKEKKRRRIFGGL